MDELADIFPSRAGFAPAADAEAFFAATPGKACVALLLDQSGGPLQLICTKNLRAMLRRRLGEPDPADAAAALPSKRVDYRSLVSGVAWRRVDGDFEMDLAYIEAARRAFPTHWRQLIPDRTAHFVAIDTSHEHPDFLRITDVSQARGAVFGPFPDKAKADRWIELARDTFDLCRYRNILAQSPKGRACSYKQMNKCPAPCDGTVPLDSYRQGVTSAVAAITSPATLLTELGEAMKGHASRLEFEQAGRMKARLATFTALGDGAHRGVRPIGEFRFISVQPGPRKGTAKLFLVDASSICEIVGIIDAQRASFEELVPLLSKTSSAPSAWPAEVLLGTACFHLAGAKSGHRFVAARDLTAERLASMLAEAAKPRAAAADDSGQPIRETRLQV